MIYSIGLLVHLNMNVEFQKYGDNTKHLGYLADNSARLLTPCHYLNVNICTWLKFQYSEILDLMRY